MNKSNSDAGLEMTKLALVTGTSAGTGKETCALFAAKDYRVIALSRQPGGIESAALELKGAYCARQDEP